MAESRAHERAKRRAAAEAGGRIECPVGRGGDRLDACNHGRAVEIERSGRAERLDKAVEKLKASRRRQRVLQVPDKDLDKAAEAMRRNCVGGTVKNMAGTRRRRVPKCR